MLGDIAASWDYDLAVVEEGLRRTVMQAHSQTCDSGRLQKVTCVSRSEGGRAARDVGRVVFFSLFLSFSLFLFFSFFPFPFSLLCLFQMAHILDQGDESEFTLADAGHITVWFHNFVAITHGQPDEEETPTNEQLSALNVRVVVQLGSPYADFAVFTLCARKTTRAHRFTACLPQPDGSWLAKEIPGPTNLQARLYCWRVFVWRA